MRGGDPVPPFRERRPQFTRADVEAHLARELVHWLPVGGEAGDVLEERQRTARAAARIIAERL